VYEVVICLVIAIEANWMYYLARGVIPNLTWVPTVVVLFPLIMPGPPRRMLVTTILAAGMWPLSILILETAGKVKADISDYAPAMVGATFVVLFAHMGARIVYRLGRDVATARDMGSYHLEALLGQGGMGEVWRARHRMLARPAAIKLIRPALLGDRHAGEVGELQSRFAREAEAIAGLRSPHTVDLFDFGVADSGAFYLVMELLDGRRGSAVRWFAR
jgi:serine/threonine-protein kinase